jgi:DeoR/GlpR family transcriptional regulator of sugar metabolism
MRASRRRVVVADGSKIGQVSLVHLYSLADIDLLITDSSADRGTIAALRERGLEVQVAE